MSNWHYAVDGGSQGPLDDGAIRSLIMRGTIGPGTLIWREGMGAWTPAGDLVEMQEALREARRARAAPPIPTAPPRSNAGIERQPFDAGMGPSDGTGGIIPHRNPLALTGYYVGIFSLIPGVGMLLSVPAIVLGVLGLRARKREPRIRGAAHAWIAILTGAVSMLAYGALTIVWFVTQRG
ncbi:MAG: DUF4339 domain-containing protein [Phycisphaera sp.]|nr:DUF4339 domain-containing protein [Phycisphaera sp.]